MAKKNKISIWEQIKNWFNNNHDYVEEIEEERTVKTCHGKDCTDNEKHEK